MTEDRGIWGDEPLEEALREAAARYHEPGAVPREAMWARIEAARGSRVIPLPLPAARWSGRRWHRAAAGAAALAAALLVGVAIGRTSRDGSLDPAAGAGAATGTAAVAGADRPVGVPSGTTGATAADAPLAEGGTMVAEATTRAGGRTDARPDASAPGSGTPDAGRPGAGSPGAAGSDPMVPYRLAAVQHMSRAEALLTTFRMGARAGEVDAAVQPWARDLLSSTRLLIDSPAAQDPALRALLGDLELVLAQIVQLPAQRRAEEVQLIDRQLDADGVITRLRTAVPSGTLARGA